MAEEVIALRIQLSASEAQAILKSCNIDLKSMAQAAQAAAPSTTTLKDVMGNLAKQTKIAADVSKVFGGDLTMLKNEHKRLAEAARDAIAQGIDPETAELKELMQQYNKLGKEISDASAKTTQTKAPIQSLSSTLGPLAGYISGAAIAAGAFKLAMTGINYNAMGEQAAVSFETFLQDGDKAKALMAELQTLSAKTPMEFPDIRDAGLQLAAVKIQASAIPEMVRRIGDVAAGSGAPIQELAYLFAKVKSQGRASAEELNSFASRGIPIFDALSDSLGKSPTAIRKMVSEGKIGFAELQNAFVKLTSQGGQYNDLMAKQAETWNGLKSTASDTANLVLGKLTAASMEPLKMALKDIIAGTEQAQGEAEQWGNSLATIVQMVSNNLKLDPQMATDLGTMSRSLREILMSIVPIFNTIGSMATGTVGGAFKYLAYLFSWVADLVSGYVDFYSNLAEGNWAGVWNAFQRIVLSWSKNFVGVFETIIKTVTGNIDKLINKLNTLPGINIKPFDLHLNWTKDLDAYIQKLETIAHDSPLKKGPDKPSQNEPDKPGDSGSMPIDTDQINAALAQLKEFQVSLSATPLTLDQQFIANLEKLDGEHIAAMDKALSLAKSAGLTQAQTSNLVSLADAAYNVKRLGYENEYAIKSRELSAQLTQSKIDDLMVERDKTLAAYAGTESQKAMLAAQWAEKIRDTEIEEAQKAAAARIDAMKKAFDQAKKFAAESGNWGAYANYEAQSQAASTQVGRMAGFAGSASIDPMQILIESAVKLALSFDSVQKLLNFMTTYGDELADVLDPLVDDALDPVLDLLLDLVGPVAQILTPAITIVALALRLVGALDLIRLTADALGDGFSLLNDYVIVPFGNGVLGVINGLIRGINSFLTSIGLGKIRLKELELLQTSTQLAEAAETLEEMQSSITDSMDALKSVFSDKSKTLEAEYDKNISALSNLLSLGVVSEKEYASRVAAYNSKYTSAQDALSKELAAQLDALDGLSSALEDGTTTVAKALAKLTKVLSGYGIDINEVSLPSFDVGTSRILSDGPATLHKDEIVASKPIADAIRNGELSLSGPGYSRGGLVVYMPITIEGDVTSEGELAAKLYAKVNRALARGQEELVS